MRYDDGWAMHDDGWWWWMGLTWLIVLVVLVGIVVWVVTMVVRSQQHHAGAGAREPRTTADPEGILAERLARGEIEAEEYTGRLRALRDAGR
jgi:putative membrane protein